jgi:hypothetical protein
MGASNVDIVRDWLLEHAGEYRTRPTLRDACAAATGRRDKYVQGRISAMMTAGDIPWLPVDMARGGAPAEAAPDMGAPADLRAVITPAQALAEEALRAKIDVHFKARAFLENIQPGQFYALDDAAVAAGLPRSQARPVFMADRYAQYRGQALADQRIYIGHPERIAAMKREGIMR